MGLGLLDDDAGVIGNAAAAATTDADEDSLVQPGELGRRRLVARPLRASAGYLLRHTREQMPRHLCEFRPTTLRQKEALDVRGLAGKRRGGRRLVEPR